MTEPQRTPNAHRRDLYRARLIIGHLKDKALASGEPFHVADLALDAAFLDELWTSWTRWIPTSGKRSPTAAMSRPSSWPGTRSGRAKSPEKLTTRRSSMPHESGRGPSRRDA